MNKFTKIIIHETKIIKIVKDVIKMNDKANNRDEDQESNFSCDFSPFHIFCKTFPGMKPFFKKGALFKHYGDRFHRGSRVPVTQVKRNQEGYTITMELPGISKDEINLEATIDELWFSAQSDEFNKEFRHHLHFKKRIRPDEMKARLRAGILTITVPFVNQVPKTKVDVE